MYSIGNLTQYTEYRRRAGLRGCKKVLKSILSTEGAEGNKLEQTDSGTVQ